MPARRRSATPARRWSRRCRQAGHQAMPIPGAEQRRRRAQRRLATRQRGGAFTLLSASCRRAASSARRGVEAAGRASPAAQVLSEAPHRIEDAAAGAWPGIARRAPAHAVPRADQASSRPSPACRAAKLPAWLAADAEPLPRANFVLVLHALAVARRRRRPRRTPHDATLRPLLARAAAEAGRRAGRRARSGAPRNALMHARSWRCKQTARSEPR